VDTRSPLCERSVHARPSAAAEVSAPPLWRRSLLPGNSRLLATEGSEFPADDSQGCRAVAGETVRCPAGGGGRAAEALTWPRSAWTPSRMGAPCGQPAGHGATRVVSLPLGPIADSIHLHGHELVRRESGHLGVGRDITRIAAPLPDIHGPDRRERTSIKPSPPPHHERG
jgi:hypothetical protein